MSPLALGLAGLVGLLLGILGGGGSVLAVPVLIYVAGYDPHTAAAVSLAVVGIVSFLAAVAHWRSGNLRLQVAAPFAITSMVGSFLGAFVAQYIAHTVQLSLLGGLMVAGGLLMRDSAASVQETMSVRSIAARGLVVGLLTGVVGVGGGFMVVPALLAGGGGLTVLQAVATSLAIIAMNCLTGFLGYVGHLDVPWLPIGQFLAASVLGMGAGTVWARFIPQRLLKQALAALLLALGAWILLHTWILKGT